VARDPRDEKTRDWRRRGGPRADDRRARDRHAAGQTPASADIHDLRALRLGESVRVGLLEGTVIVASDDGRTAQGDTIADAQRALDDLAAKFATARETPLA
jgi:hypothetical protein